MSQDPIVAPSDATNELDSSTPAESKTTPVTDGESTPSDTEIVKQRFLRGSTIVVGLVLCMLAVAINWPLKYIETRASGTTGSVIDFSRADGDPPVMAGAPFRYGIWYPETQTLPSVSAFSSSALLFNVLICGLVIALFMFYVHRKGVRLASTRNKISLTIADLLLLTFVLAAGFGWWQYQDSRSKTVRSYAAKFSRGSNGVRISAWIPKILQPILHDQVAKRLVAVRGIRMENPSTDEIKRALAFRTLTCFRVGGDSYELEELNALGGLIHLHDLRVAGRKLDQATIQTVGSHRRLDTLNLMRTNITSEALLGLDRLATLRRLNLVHCDVQLSELGTPNWSDSIEELIVGHPTSGSDSLAIQGWPSLEKLTVNELDTQINSSVVAIKLSDLPKLKKLSLDRFQYFDLTLNRLPELSEIESLEDNWRSRLSRGGSMPGALWVRGILGEDLPQLTQLEFNTLNLERFQIRGTPKLKKLLIGAFRKWSNRSTYHRIPPASIRAMLEGVGTAEVELADLDSLYLEGVDLSPLAKNRKITTLLLASSGTTVKQWESLGEMKQLRHLRINGEDISLANINRVLNLFPNLETLDCDEPDQYQDRSNITFVTQNDPVLELRNRPALRTLDLPQFGFGYRNVHISEMPVLRENFDFGWVAEELEINDAPALTGLSFMSPLPSKVTLKGLRDLQYFAAGGKSVDDSVVRSLSPCAGLAKLTLAYAGASEDSLGSLPLRSISSLHLPGCNVTDAVIRSWGEMPSLTTADFSHTKITGAGLATLVKSPFLSSLRLDGCNIQASDLAPVLADKVNLNSLFLAGVGIDAETIGKVVENNDLKTLDLSGTKVSDETLDALTNAKLQLLILKESEFDSQKLYDLLSAHPKTMLDMSGSEMDPAIWSALMDRRRIVDAEEYQQQLTYLALVNSSNTRGRFANFSPMAMNEETIIDISDFAPDGTYGKNAIAQRSFMVTPSRPSAVTWLQGLFTGGNQDSDADPEEGSEAEDEFSDLIDFSEEAPQ